MRTKLLIIAIVVLSIVGCRSDAPTVDGTLSNRTTTIGDLRTMVGTSQGKIIDGDVVVHGRVTSSDKEGNFWRSFTVEDETGALEVLIAERNLATIYPEGLLIALHIKGCAACYRQGVLQIGMPTEEYDYYDATYIESREMEERIIRRSADVQPLTPRLCRIADLSEGDRGRLIRVEGLTLCHTTSIDTLTGMSLADATWQGYALFKDEHGDSIAVYTSSDAHFATLPIATTPLAITGIVQWSKYDGGRECHHLKMRYAADASEM